MAVHSSLKSSLALYLALLLAFVVSVESCAKVTNPIKNLFKSRIHEVNGPSCFTIASMRTVDDNEGTYDSLGPLLSSETCRNLCKEKGHEKGKIISVSVGLCHCDKNFKKTGAADISKCTEQCPGNPDERCGGPDHVSAYPA